jgi:hypothetical protein
MKLFLNAKQQVKNKILQLIENGEIVESPDPADVCVLIRNDAGGLGDLSEGFNIDPQKVIVVAGYPDRAGESHALKAEGLLISPERIFFVPAGRKLDLNFIAARIAEMAVMAVPASPEEELDISWEDEQEEQAPAESAGESPVTEAESESRSEIIWVAGCRGGVGRTTIAAALLTHYLDIGEKACLADFGLPGAAHRHIDKGEHPRMQNVFRPGEPILKSNAYTELLKELRGNFTRVIVDLPAEIPPGLLPHISAGRLIAVVDSDLVQTVLPLSLEPEKYGKAADVYVYNRCRPEVPAETVEAHLNAEIIAVQEDYQGCMAALAAGRPASEESESMAVAVGEITARLGGGYAWSLV